MPVFSAIIGFASILILLPVPGYIATRMQTIQAKKMEQASTDAYSRAKLAHIMHFFQTDARVEAVTESKSGHGYLLTSGSRALAVRTSRWSPSHDQTFRMGKKNERHVER